MPFRNVPLSDRTLQDRLLIVQEQILSACQRSGRLGRNVAVIAITKTFPPKEIRKAYALGLVHFGENRVQEVVDKFGDESLHKDCPNLNLHLVGHLQTNKVRKAMQYVSCIDSVDSVRLAEIIDREAEQAGRRIRILLEVNTSGEPQKYGFLPKEIQPLIETTLKLRSLDLAGLMTVGPNVDDPQTIRRSFFVLRKLFDDIRNAFNPPHWAVLSMGMSGDFEIAVEEGATEIRLGTALFGERSAL